MMRRAATSLFFVLFLCLGGVSTWSRAQVPSADAQISAAVQAAPEDLRAGARVIGYNSSQERVTLREGANRLICLADDPSDDEFHVACYHESLEPFMARGRELRSKGMSRTAVDSVRLAEIRSGDLSMPEEPTALYSLSASGSEGDPAQIPSDASRLHVVYVPYATGESTGLSTQPAGGRPWLMEPGRPWAHIMISVDG